MIDDLVKKFNECLIKDNLCSERDSGLSSCIKSRSYDIREIRSMLSDLGLKLVILPLGWNHPDLIPRQTSFEEISDSFDVDPLEGLKSDINFMYTLSTNYLANMEGCDSKEFLYWESLYVAASKILEAMQEELGENEE